MQAILTQQVIPIEITGTTHRSKGLSKQVLVKGTKLTGLETKVLQLSTDELKPRQLTARQPDLPSPALPTYLSPMGQTDWLIEPLAILLRLPALVPWDISGLSPPTYFAKTSCCQRATTFGDSNLS